MALRFGIAFSLAAWVTLLGFAWLRSEAQRARRSRRVSERRELWLRQLGGPIVAAGVLAGWIATPSPPAWVGILALAATAVCVLGLVDERRRLRPEVRLAAVVAAAGAVVLSDVRAAPFGSDLLDSAITIAWIVLATAAFRRLDHSDGLPTGAAVLGAVGMFAIAAPADGVTATICVAVAGAALAAFAYNTPPASIRLGAGGAAFVGFVLAVGAVEIEPDVGGVGGLLVPLLLLAIPLLDWVIVNLSRAWQGVPLARSRRDHLGHRLARTGFTREEALAALLGVQLLLTLLAVLVAYEVIAPILGFAVGGALLTIVTVRALEGARPRPTETRRGALVITIGVVCGAVIVLGGLAAWDGLRELRSAQAALEAALDAGRSGDAGASRAEFLDAVDAFEHAQARLDGPFMWPARALPVVSENLRAARELARSGADVSEAGAELARAGGERLQVTGGVVRVDEVRHLTPDIQAAAALVQTCSDRIDDIRRPFLLGPVRDRVEEAQAELTQAAREAQGAVAAAQLAPAIFGGDGTRHYFLAAQNNAELRATGGIIGNWGILTVEDGDVELDEFARTQLLNDYPPEGEPRTLDAAPGEYVARYGRFSPGQIWQNVNMTPDFPTVGSIIGNLYPQSGGDPIDGVVSVDPLGLQALLELTGPVLVEGWPVPITADNVIDVTLKQQYEAFPTQREEREEFLGDVAEAVWDQATTVDLGNPAQIARVLGRAGREGHLALWFTRPEEQALAVDLGVAGVVPELESDAVLVTAQNGSANKVDYYLTRRIDYDVELHPASGRQSARVEGRLEVEFDNAAPAGISSYALGPWDARFEAGENRSFVSVYTPLAFAGATVDDIPVQMETATELGRNVFSAYVSVPAESSRTLEMQLQGSARLEPGGWYVLDLVRQPTLHPDAVQVSIEVPEGWRIVAVKGAEHATPRRAVEQVTLRTSRQVRVQVERA